MGRRVAFPMPSPPGFQKNKSKYPLRPFHNYVSDSLILGHKKPRLSAGDSAGDGEGKTFSLLHPLVCPCDERLFRGENPHFAAGISARLYLFKKTLFAVNGQFVCFHFILRWGFVLLHHHTLPLFHCHAYSSTIFHGPFRATSMPRLRG
jgi:hypothetical protein